MTLPRPLSASPGRPMRPTLHLSVARAAYWQGRAAEETGDSEGPRRFYDRAASAPTAYYGQLAAQRLGQTRLIFRAPKAAAEGDRA